jgi:hypothetical protein
MYGASIIRAGENCVPVTRLKRRKRRNAFRQAGAHWETRYTLEAAAAACVKMQTESSVTIRPLMLARAQWVSQK